MTIVDGLRNMFSKLFQWFSQRSLVIKLLIVFLVITGGGITTHLTRSAGAKKTSYQTATVEKSTFIVSVSVSGQVSSANSAQVTTQASGVVKTVYVKDGNTVKAGDPIALIDLDLTGKQRSQQAYASYQSAQNNLANAKANLYTSQSTLLTEWETFMNLAQNNTYENTDGTPNTGNRQRVEFMTNNDDWLAAEAKYKVQEQAITQTTTALNSSWFTYQQSSPTIVAPISGIITGLSLQPGSVITPQTNSSGGSSSQRIASVKTDVPPTISLNITQIDAPKVKAGNKATLTFDAFPDKTFTGEVISIDTIGSESSGVTTYPAIIKLDTPLEGLLPNMSASADIITATKNDILLVPTTAIQTIDGASYVQVVRNKQVSRAEVTTGLASDTQTEIVSGLNAGDTIITSTTNAAITTQSGQSSPFSPFGGSARGAGGGRQFMIAH